MKYQILDNQIHGRLFADGETFDTKDDILDQLIDYHSNDCDEEDIETLQKMTLEEILDYGDWEIVELTPKQQKQYEKYAEWII